MNAPNQARRITTMRCELKSAGSKGLLGVRPLRFRDGFFKVKGDGQECPSHTIKKQQVPHRAFSPVRNDIP
jgi:hypothetical protein